MATEEKGWLKWITLGLAAIGGVPGFLNGLGQLSALAQSGGNATVHQVLLAAEPWGILVYAGLAPAGFLLWMRDRWREQQRENTRRIDASTSGLAASALQTSDKLTHDVQAAIGALDASAANHREQVAAELRETLFRMFGELMHRQKPRGEPWGPFPRIYRVDWRTLPDAEALSKTPRYPPPFSL